MTDAVFDSAGTAVDKTKRKHINMERSFPEAILTVER
jgi:hypothetical protein